MISPNWYGIAQTTSERNVERRSATKSHVTSSQTAVLVVVSIVILLWSMALLSANTAAASGSNPRTQSIDNYSNPANPIPMASSQDPTVLVNPSHVPLVPVGSSFTVQIKVSNMSQFNGWDIQIQATALIINASSLSITGNDFAKNASFGSPGEFAHCVNGRGTGCTASDGRGIVHSAYGNTAILGGAGIIGAYGLLFTINYTVTGDSALLGPSAVSMFSSLISDPNSGNGVPHGDVPGTYGAPSGTVGGTGMILEVYGVPTFYLAAAGLIFFLLILAVVVRRTGVSIARHDFSSV